MNQDLAKNVLKRLTKQEQAILADLWESDARKVLEKLLGQRQLQIAQLVLSSSADHYYTREMRGRAMELNELTTLLSSNLKTQNNLRNK